MRRTFLMGAAIVMALPVVSSPVLAQDANQSVEEPYSQQTLRRFQNTPNETPEMPKAILALVQRGAQARYLGFYEGMHGWMTIQQGKPAFYYVTPNGKALVRGFMFDLDGAMVTGEQITQLKMREGAQMMALSDIELSDDDTPTGDEPDIEAVADAAIPDLAPAPAPDDAPELDTTTLLFQSMDAANGFIMGDPTKPLLYSFIDPDCEHCRAYIRAITPYVNQGFVSLKVIPVGFEDSARQRAAFLLSAGNPAERLSQYVAGDNNALASLSRVSEDGVMQNIRIMSEWRLDATPVVIYADGLGNPKLIRGIPKDTQALVSDAVKG